MEKGTNDPPKNLTEEIKNWLKTYVIGLNLCPFTSHPYENDLVQINLCFGATERDWVETFIQSCNQMISIKSNELSTTLIVYTQGLERFELFLDFFTTFKEMLEQTGLHEFIQLASFHPSYQFDGTHPEDVTNYTNRSPYPIIQLLRVDEVENAIKSYGDTSTIFKKNILKMNEIGIENLKKMLQIKSK